MSLLKDSYEEFEVKLNYCGCKRKIKIQSGNSNFWKNIWFNQTTCSLDAYSRGKGQKIIGFSLYGDYNLRRL